jgi:hypothetical protein
MLRADGMLGLMMLDTRFPRPAGDLGLIESWPVPVNRAVMHGAWPAKVVQSKAGLRQARVVEGFCQLARQLRRDGVRAITTSCGFLVLMQKELQAMVDVPVVTSSLLQLPGLLEQAPQVGVLTISASQLKDEHLRCAGVPRERLRDVLVEGVDPQGEFASAILGNRSTMDLARARADVLAAALRLKARAPQLHTVVLECTNMPPYADAITAATGLRTVSLLQSRRLLQPFEAKP